MKAQKKQLPEARKVELSREFETLNSDMVNIKNRIEEIKQLLDLGQLYPPLEIIRDEVCKYYNITPEKLCVKRKFEGIVKPRQLAMSLSAELTTVSYSNIGLYYGGFDHATIWHAKRVIKDLMYLKEIKQAYEFLTEEIKDKTLKFKIKNYANSSEEQAAALGA